MTAFSQLSHPARVTEFVPHEIRPGVFGTTFYREGEPLFLRMELLTEANARNWAQFQTMTWWVANGHTGGLLGRLVDLAGTSDCLSHDLIEENTGFTKEEYRAFIAKAIQQKKKTANKIVRLLEKNSVGSSAMFTPYIPGQLNYIAYITKNPLYSVPYVETKDRTLKNYINAYSDVLISMGSDFSKESTFHNRGISRNPCWVFEDKYGGLSMLLHGFTAAFAEEYSPEKLFMQVRPVGSMQVILQKNLLPKEGYAENNDGSKTDITSLECSADGCEHQTNTITVSALIRIYRAALSSMNEYIIRKQTKGCAYPLAI